jgi:hyperosmotically inducible protein
MFKRFFISIALLAAFGVPATAMAAPVAGAADRALAADISDHVQNYVYYTIFDDVQGTVRDGMVTLTGKVTDPYKASQIGKLVKQVAGVRELDNKIVSLPASIFDDQLRTVIANRIYRDPMFWSYGMQPNPPIHIIVDHGHVTLTGVVNSEVERRVAEATARNADFAFSVENKLRLDREIGSSN